jgi:pilus assembly protein CpaD
MKTPKEIIKFAALGLSLITLAACQHTGVSTRSPEQNVIRNSVQMVRLPLVIQGETDGTDTLSSVTEASIKNFLQSVGAGYGDIIMLDAPDASSTRVKAIEAMIVQTGLAYGGTSVLGAKPQQGAVMLYVERYTVQSPNCNYWPEVTSNQDRNNNSSFHGCATTINLGLMVANPRDLVGGSYSGTDTRTAVSAIYTPPTKGGAPKLPGQSSGSGNGTSGVKNAVGSLPK